MKTSALCMVVMLVSVCAGCSTRQPRGTLPMQVTTIRSDSVSHREVPRADIERDIERLQLLNAESKLPAKTTSLTGKFLSQHALGRPEATSTLLQLRDQLDETNASLEARLLANRLLQSGAATSPPEDVVSDAVFDANVAKSMNEILARCDVVLNGMQGRSTKRSSWVVGLYGLGVVAGSVAVPGLAAANAAANAGWIAALGGLSGASTMMGKALEDGALSGSSDAITRNEIAQKLRDQVLIAGNGDRSRSERNLAVATAQAECVAYQIKVPQLPGKTD